MLIAVAPHKRFPGVDPLKGPSDFRARPRSAANVRRVEPVYQVAHVDNAFREAYPSDAHFVAYIVMQDGAPIMRQPRVNKDGLAWMRAEGYELVVGGLVADVDNPGHAPWGSYQAALEGVLGAKAKVPTAIVYATRGGLRVVQPLRRKLVVDDAEGTLAAWFGQLEQAGLVPDRACLDWTRHYRMPSVVREERAA